ncbi:unnamed protein product [Phytophthora lilii]|uniref:Unnamed protein product n=1 Tax=Phytophthora lilii TaxID=2077276 RepID=A0A9W6WSU2_9STRA|nr:unnamed protein product [Phytophthora lilii]
MLFELEDWRESDLLADVEMFLTSQDCIGALIPTHFKRDDITDSTPSETGGSEDATPSRPCDVGRSKMYRVRQKNKLVGLRREEETLRKALAQLKKYKARVKAVFDAAQTATYFESKNLAMRQREKRMQAEAEQRQLTVAVKAQATYIQTLLKDYREWQLQPAVSESQQELGTKRRTISSEGELFEAYLRELELSYGRTDEVIRTVA